ncbi:hypothetical protein KL942_001407 [Ogataea angusta]|uniref:Uncharacterized protein n=1 Tax=Pichia angusta TaxID=870730 RepID=A0ABQ7S0Q0_PICAN|nr:hypothetical protein KL942_001407 [Ogataea angusta]KAG7850895.1 hypothetical protein KL940_001472 [Ogataea angusta]
MRSSHSFMDHARHHALHLVRRQHHVLQSEQSVQQQCREQVADAGEVRVQFGNFEQNWLVCVLGRDAAVETAFGLQTELLRAQKQRRDHHVLDVVFRVQRRKGASQVVAAGDLEVQQQLQLELVWRDHVDEATVHQLPVDRDHVLADVELAVVAHDGVQQPETLGTAFFDGLAHLADRGQGAGAVDVAREQGVVADVYVAQPGVELGQLVARDHLAMDTAVARVVGEVDRVEHVDVPAERLERERGGLVPHVAVGDVRLDREELHGTKRR